MGESVTGILPQGPERHCGQPGYHPKHQNTHPLPPNPVDGTWCSGVPVLEPFVEVTVRVPFNVALKSGEFVPKDHRGALMMLAIIGLGSVLVDNLDHADTRMTLRLRAGREDRFYQVRTRREVKDASQ